MLAAIPGELLGLVIFGVAMLLKWLGDRAAEQQTTKAPPPIPQRPNESRSAASSTRGDPEAERRRRFMEALGIPVEDLLGPSKEAPKALRPESQAEVPPKPRESRSKPIPPIVFQEPADWRKPRPKRAATPPPFAAPAAPPVIAPVPVAAPVAAVAPSSAAHKATDLVELQGLVIGDMSEAGHGVFHESIGSSLREELRRPDALRRAWVLREILGPPLGLQSANSVPTFPTP